MIKERKMKKDSSHKNILNATVLSELYEIGIALTSNIELAEILELVGESARQVLVADRAVCHLYNQASNQYTLATDLGKKLLPKLIRRPRENGPTATIVKSGIPLISNDAQYEDTPYRDSPFTKAANVQSVIGLPLKKANEIVGVLYINYHKKGAITSDILNVANLIANQAAIAIYNARLFQELAERQESLTRLVDAGQSLSEAIAQSEEIETKPITKIVLDEIARVACNISGAACATIYPFSPTREEYYSIGSEGAWGLNKPLNLHDKPRIEGGMAARVKKENVIIINDVSLEKTELRDSKFLRREGIKAFVGVSVHTEVSHLAVLYVSLRKPHLFSTEEVNTIRLFANQAGVALQVARLLEKEQNARANLEMLALLNKIGSALSHRVIGIVGTIPVETKMVRDYLKKLDVKSPEIEYSLSRIEGDNSVLREMATSLKKLPELMGTPEPVNVNELLSKIINSNSHLYSSVQVHEKYNPTLPIVNVPQTQIKEVFENIMGNAVEHLPNCSASGENGKMDIKNKTLS